VIAFSRYSEIVAGIAHFLAVTAKADITGLRAGAI
jgi:hypothetical protein